MKNRLLIPVCLLWLAMFCFGQNTMAQKKVAAVVTLAGDVYKDSLVVDKGKSFVVQLPVRNRAGDDWVMANSPAKLKFTESMLGQAGMLPNQEEPKLMFYKATDKGVDSIKFVYRNPKAAAGTAPEERTLYVTVQ